MMCGNEHQAKLLDITAAAIAPDAITGSATDVVASAALQISRELFVFIEFLQKDEDGVNPEIVLSVLRGLSARAQALSALVSTRMRVQWAPALTADDSDFAIGVPANEGGAP